MKVYVDKLPKICIDCPCLHLDEWCAFCNLNAFDGNHCPSRELDKQRHKDCPLTLISDHDKQVRKEVCGELKEKIMDYYVKGNTAWFNVEKLDKDIVWEILDQIQGEK